MKQRSLVAEVTGAFEGWRKTRADFANGFEFQVETPVLQQSEFNCAEVLESALAAVRKRAEENGAQVQTSIESQLPRLAHGNPQHIHQLITLLASSLKDVAGSERLELRVAFEA